MIRRSMRLLRPAGRLVFSTNYTRFRLDAAALADLAVEDISDAHHSRRISSATRAFTAAT